MTPRHFTLALVLTLSSAASTTASAQDRIWTSAPPADCPFPPSTTITGVVFTGRNITPSLADTWYLCWAADDKLYSPFADGVGGTHMSVCYNPDAKLGFATVTGDNPLNLKVVSSGILAMPAQPYGGRYPCGSLVLDGIWYYGSYCTMNENGSIQSDIQTPDLGRINWGVIGPFCGFHTCTNLADSWRAETWTPSPHNGLKPLFPEPARPGKAVKIGAPHFVDFGRNLQHSPDGKAYLVAHGATDDDPRPRFANLSWINGDHIYLIRVRPGLATMNDASQYEFFAGHDAKGDPVWTRTFTDMKPLVDWNNHCGSVAMTYNAPLKKHLLCITDGWPTAKEMDTYILESDLVTGPWKLVAYMAKFGTQGYFVNFPSRFIGADGRAAWLCYSANFASGRPDPAGSKYGMCLQEVRLLGPAAAR